jgi:hypothetical protein
LFGEAIFQSVREDLGAILSPPFIIAFGVLTPVSLGLADGEADAVSVGGRDKDCVFLEDHQQNPARFSAYYFTNFIYFLVLYQLF